MEPDFEQMFEDELDVLRDMEEQGKYLIQILYRLWLYHIIA